VKTDTSSRIERTTSIVALVTAVVALAGAVTGTVRNAQEIRSSQKEIRLQGKQIQALKSASSIVAFLSIESPEEGETISGNVYDAMHGSLDRDIPYGYTLWVLAKDRYNYFLMYPPTQFARTMGKWSQTNVRLNTPGRWELHVCLADKKASAALQSKADRNDLAGFPTLPPGMETVHYVTVQKR